METLLETLSTLATKADMLALKTDITEFRTKIIKWVICVNVASATTIIAAMVFMLKDRL